MVRFCKPGSSSYGKDAADKECGIAKRIKQNWIPLALGLIVLIAIIARTIYSYGLSAGNGFALSGSSATEHQHTIVSILTGTFGLSDPSLNYPYGGTLMQPPFIDMILAGFAWIPTLLGVSAQTAAAGALAFSGPVAAAITVILVYILGKEMFDRNIGIVSAFLFAVMPLPVVMSVFSDGTTMGILLMFFVIATLLMFRGIKALSSTEIRGIKAAFTPGVLKYTISAGLMFAIIALSWNGFIMIVTLLVFLMAAQAIISRLNKRDFGASFGAYATMISILIIIPLPYYVAAGLFSYVYTGPLLLSAISVAAVALFYYMRKKSNLKAFVIPILAVAAAFVVLYFAAPQLFSDVTGGNAIYESSLLADLLKSQNVGISKMASYYGWATVWMPFVMIAYLSYKLDKKNPSETKLMTVLWITGMFILSWLSKDNAIMAGAMYSIVAASALTLLYRYVGMTEYFRTIRGGGWKASLKKFLRPEPFISLICVLCLVIAPNAVLLADATTSSNRDGSSGGYLGGINYFVDTDEDNPTNMMWDHYYDETKDGALATWFENSSKAADRGGFVSVTSDSGQGAVAVSNILLSKGSAGAISAMIIRMVLAEGVNKYADLMDDDLVAGLKKIIDNPSETKGDVLKDSETYPGISADLNEENAIYLAASNLLTSELSETEIHKLYSEIREISNGAISYIAISGDMLPMFQNDGSLFPTLAYLNNYALDSNGAANKYYSHGYILNYTDAMFESFIWKALIGLNSETGINFYAAVSLALSDGTLAASPGLGLTGFEVDYWQVKYNPDEDATLSDGGWVYMNGYEAVEKQKNEGGLINYLSSIMVLKVSDLDDSNVKSGTVTSGGVAFAGAKVAVFEKDPNGVWVQRSTAFTDENGEYSVMVPDADYQIRVYVSTEMTVGGTYLKYNTGSDFDFSLDSSVIKGSVEGDLEGMIVEAVGKYSGTTKSEEIDNTGVYEISGLVPDKYDVYLKLNGKTIDTTTITVYPGSNSGVDFGLSSTLKVTVKDIYGVPTDGEVVLVNKYDGTVITKTTADGIAEFKVMKVNDDIENTGMYIVYVKDTIGTSSEVKVSGSSAAASITIFETVSETGNNITVMAPGYSSFGQSDVLLPGIGDAVYTLVYKNGEVRTYSVKDGFSEFVNDVVEFNAELKSKSDTAIQGTITFYGEDGVTFTYASDEEGKVTAKVLPGTYTVSVVGKNGTCLIQDEVVVPGTTAEDATVFKTDTGRTVKATFTFSSSTDGSKGVPFTKVKFVVETEGKEYTIYGTTDSSGVASVTVPKSANVKVSIDDGGIGVMEWIAKENDVGTGTSTTFSVSSSKMDKPEIDLENTWLWPSSDLSGKPSYKVADDASDNKVKVSPGTYYCIVKESSGLYTYSKVKVYYGHDELYHDSETVVDNLSLLTVTAPDDSKVTVEAHPDSEGAKYYKVKFDADTIQYLMTDGEYLFKAVKDDNISYALITVPSSDTVDLTSYFEKKATLKGYLGVDGDGVAEIDIDGVKLFTKVKKGVYSVDVPEMAGKSAIFDVKLTYKPSDSEYTYEYAGTFSVSIPESEGEDVQVITTNAYLRGDGTIAVTSDELVIAADITHIDDNGFTFEMTVTPAAGSEGIKTYAVKAVGPWQLDKSYVFTITDETAKHLTINGIFSPSNVNDRDKDMKVSIVNLEGKAEATGEISGIYMPSENPADKVTVTVSGDNGAASDLITDNEYIYAITMRNYANKEVTVELSVSGVSGEWIYVVSDESGRKIVTDYSVEKGLTLSGNSKTVLHVKLMNVNGGLTDIPEVTVNVAVPAGVVIDKNVLTLEPEEIKLDSSLSVEGNNVYDTGNAMQTAFWVFAVLSIIMIALIVWLGSKRGVFSRRK